MKSVHKIQEEMDMCDPESIDKYVFYKAVLIVIEVVKGFAQRYADLARELAIEAEDERKDELIKIAEICEKVPYEKSNNLKEAIQSCLVYSIDLTD